VFNSCFAKPSHPFHGISRRSRGYRTHPHPNPCHLRLRPGPAPGRAVTDVPLQNLAARLSALEQHLAALEKSLASRGTATAPAVNRGAAHAEAAQSGTVSLCTLQMAPPPPFHEEIFPSGWKFPCRRGNSMFSRHRHFIVLKQSPLPLWIWKRLSAALAETA